MSIGKFWKTCIVCNRSLLAMNNFPITLGETPMPPAFSDVCFDCTPLAGGKRKGEHCDRILCRPPTLEEYPDGLQPYHDDKVFLPLVPDHFREFRQEKELKTIRNGERCRICHRDNTVVPKLKRRGSLTLCPRCFQSMPAAVREASKTDRFESSPLYPYKGLFRRIGPHRWARVDNVLFYLHRSYNDLIAYATRYEEYKNFSDFANDHLKESRGAVSFHSGRGYRRLVALGHHMYLKDIHSFQSLPVALNNFDPRKNRTSGETNSKRLFRYLLGDAFPHPEKAYDMVRIAVANKAYQGKWWQEEMSPGDLVPKSELLAVLLCPRVLSVAALQYFNATLAIAILSRIPKESEFYRSFGIERLIMRILPIVKHYNDNVQSKIQRNEPSAPNILYHRPGALRLIEKQEVGLLEAIANAPLDVSEYTFEHVASDLAKVLLANDDEWWTMLNVGELIVRVRILESGLDPCRDSIRMKEVWTQTITKLWKLVEHMLYPEKLRDPNFSFPRKPPKEKRKPLEEEFSYEQPQIKIQSNTETQCPQGPNTEDPAVRLGVGGRADPGVPGSP